MRTPDEIKKGLELCYEDIDCSECPYLDECFGNDEEPFGAVMPDALAYIQQLEAANAELPTKVKQLEAKCHQLERERDAAVECLSVKKSCEACKYCKTDAWDEPCVTCISSLLVLKPNWEWRGVKEDEHGQEI